MIAESLLKKFGSAVRQSRLSNGWSQEELAEHSGLDRTYVSSVERGKRNVSLINIFRLAKALGITAGDLLQGVGGKDE